MNTNRMRTYPTGRVSRKSRSPLITAHRPCVMQESRPEGSCNKRIRQTEDKECSSLDFGIDAEHMDANDPLRCQIMNGLRRHHALQRLIAATVSLALVLASVIGAHGHAIEHSHDSTHGHHHTGSIEQVLQVAQAVQTASNGLSAVDGDHQVDTRHTGCTDFICHGGLAVLASGCPALTFELRDENLPWTSQVTSQQGVFSLERPPKFHVLA